MSEKMRDSFAKWYGEQAQYGKAHEDELWRAWQASRAALVVEMPDEKKGRYLDSYQEGWNDAISSCEQRIEDCGVSYK